jgi:hypothetical protein
MIGAASPGKSAGFPVSIPHVLTGSDSELLFKNPAEMAMVTKPVSRAKIFIGAGVLAIVSLYPLKLSQGFFSVKPEKLSG